MNVIIPMAGMGKRMRPHTLTVPKPLIPVAGKPIVQRLVEDIAEVCEDKIDEIAFIIGDFGEAVEQQLHDIAGRLGAKARICHQDEPLGTAHAIYCAKEALEGNVIVAFADTLFRANFNFDKNSDGIIWVSQVDDPSAFGVIKMDNQGVITDFVEKPEVFVSDKAIIGIYYFKDGGELKREIEYLLDNDIKEKGEYQITNALENMKQKGAKFIPGEVMEWLDCGNKDATVYTNQRVLSFKDKEDLIAKDLVRNNAIVIEPCFIGEGVVLENAIVGPHVSIGAGTRISNSVVKNCIIQSESTINNQVLANSMVGNHVVLDTQADELSVGDFTTQK